MFKKYSRVMQQKIETLHPKMYSRGSKEVHILWLSYQCGSEVCKFDAYAQEGNWDPKNSSQRHHMKQLHKSCLFCGTNTCRY